jgi:3-oxoacyl-[acyl-carrier protein] reductase
MAVNARGVWLAIKAVVPPMRTGQGGSIINVSSNVSLSGRPNMIHYIASKAAVIGITRGAARELGEDNIRVNAVLPGSTLTDEQRAHTSPERAQLLLQSQAIKRNETPEDIVGAVAFLASNDARFITGQTITVDGGLVLN